MNSQTDQFRFGQYLVDGSTREIRCDGKSVEVQPKVFDLLIYLITNHDRAVDKDELQDKVWPGMVITETALTRAVMKARKAVGDDASRQQAIKTLHGHGYRFVAELISDGGSDLSSVIETAGDSTVASEGSETVSRSAGTGRTLAILTMVAVLMVLSWFFLRPQAPLAAETRVAILPVIDNTGDPEFSWASLGLMSYAGNLITTDGSLPVVPVGSVVALIENFAWSGKPSDESNIPLFSKLESVYKASHILSMEIISEGRALRLNYSLLGVDGEQQQGTIVGDDGTDLVYGAVQAVYGILLQKSRLGDDFILVSKDPFNNEAFARGMGLALKGRCAEAVQFFRVIIEQEPELFSPRFEYAACLRILGETTEAEALLNDLVKEQRALSTIGPLARSLMTLGILYNRTGRLDEAMAVYDEALSISSEAGERELSARILQNQAIVLKDRSKLDEAEKLLDLAVLEYHSAGRDELPGQLFSTRANIAMARGELVEAEGHLEMALSAFREIGDRRNEAMMLNNTGYLKRRQGKLDEAEEFHLRSLEIREAIGDRVGVGRIYSMLSVVYTARGQYEDAIKAAQSALGVARETNDRLFEGTSLAQLAEAEKSLGQVEAARLNYLQAREVFVAIGDVSRTLQSDLKIASMDLDADQLDSAESIAIAVLTTSRSNDIMSTELRAYELLGDVSMARKDTEAAIIEYQSAFDLVKETSWASKENTLNRKLANAYMDMGDGRTAAPYIGALSGDEPNVQSLKAQARYSSITGSGESAVQLMSEAKVLAGIHWAEESEAALQQYLSQTGSN